MAVGRKLTKVFETFSHKILGRWMDSQLILNIKISTDRKQIFESFHHVPFLQNSRKHPNNRIWNVGLSLDHDLDINFRFKNKLKGSVAPLAAAGGSQDLTRRLTWGALSAKLNETTTLMPHISRTKQTDNMNFSTRIRKTFWVSMQKVGTHAKILCCWALCEHVNSAHVCIPGITGEKTHA